MHWREAGDFAGNLDPGVCDERAIGLGVRAEGLDTAEVTQLAVLLVDDGPGAQVDGKGEGDDEPHRAVEDSDAEVVPRQCDPAPELYNEY